MEIKNSNAPPESALSSQDKSLENQSLAHEHKPLACAKPEAQSIGERIWHDFTYNGVNYAANLAVSLVIWDFFTAGKGKVVKNATHKGISKTLMLGGAKAEAALKQGEGLANDVFSPLGGHLMMIPVKYLEDHARYFTHRINQMMDPEYKFKDIQATINTPEEELPPLSDEPSKQKWSHIAVRRGLGWGAVIASGALLSNVRGGHYRRLLQEETEGLITWGMKETSKMTNTTALSNLAENSTFKRYLNLFALDAYFTIITSGVTEATKSWFSKDKKEQAAAEQTPAIASVNIPSVEPNVTKETAASAPSTELSTSQELPSPILLEAQQIMKPHSQHMEHASLHASHQAHAGHHKKDHSFVDALHQNAAPSGSYQPSV